MDFGVTEGLLLASVAMSAGAAVVQGSAAASAAQAERAQIEDQKTMNQLQAIDEERARREKLNQVLSAQRAQAAGMGIDMNRSGSFAAMQRADVHAAEREIDQIRLMARSTNRQLSLASQAKSTEATASLLGGYLRFGGTLASGAYEYNRIGSASSTQKGPKR